MGQHPPFQAAPSRFAVRCAIAYAAAMGVNGILLPFFPVWLKSLFLNDFQIGLILTVPIIFRIFAAPVAGAIADRINERARVLVLSAAISVLTAIALIWAGDFWMVLIVFSLQGAAFAPYTPVLESITVMGVRRWGYRYGLIRVWGSIGFVTVTMLAGFAIARLGGGAVPSLVLVAFILTLLAAMVAPRLGRAKVEPASAKGGAAVRLPFKSSLNLLMIGCTLTQSTHGMYYAFSAIHWESIGFSGSQIGLLWAAGVLAEILFFFLSGVIVRRLSAVNMIVIGSLVAALRWGLFALPLSFSASLLLQTSHAFSFAFLHFGMQQKIVEVVHESQESSVQGRFFFYNGAFLALSTFVSGLIYQRFGQNAYFVMAGLALLGLALTLRVSRRAWKL